MVNRASHVTVGIGGKGTNTARMVKQLGGHPVLVGFAGGENGALLEKMLDAEAVGYRHVVVEGETRICQTLVEEGNPETTELVEEMPPIRPDNWEQMKKLFGSLELSGSIVTISGKLPAGAPVDAYAHVCETSMQQGGRVILDCPGEPLLRALEHKPFMVKINDAELLETVNAASPLQGCRELIHRGAQSVLITCGGRNAYYMDSSRTLEIEPPVIRAVNPVGSGDAVTAGVSVELARGADILHAINTGMACGAANALTLVSGLLDPAAVERLRSAVRVNPVYSR
jgi:1-phosphofructokinase family hexose kinase